MSIGKKIQLKNSELKGKVVRLHLPADITRSRPNDLWWVEWEDGRNGVIDLEKDIL